MFIMLKILKFVMLKNSMKVYDSRLIINDKGQPNHQLVEEKMNQLVEESSNG